MKLDPEKYRFRSTFTGKLVLQINLKTVTYAGAEVQDDPIRLAYWRDAKVTDLTHIIGEE